jgi:hypothetical protein
MNVKVTIYIAWEEVSDCRSKKQVLSLANVRYTVATLSAI